MKRLILTLILGLAPAFAIAETVSISGKSYSLMLKNSEPTFVSPLGEVTCRFYTSYDLIGEFPPNGELVGIDTGPFRTGWQCFDNDFGMSAGGMQLDLGMDSDQNGINDICEKDKNVSTDVTGFWSGFFRSGRISGTMTKNSNSQHGYYKLLMKDVYFSTPGWNGFVDIPLVGDFYTGVFSGTCNYSKPDYYLTCTYSGTFETEGFFPLEIQGPLIVIDDNTIDAGGIGRFVRSGNKYSKTIRLYDGNPDTPFADYTKWYLEIQDTNDFDRDGIPDLSDTEINLNLQDAILALQVVAGISPPVNVIGDVNGDERSGLEEAIFALQVIAGLRQ